MTLDLPLIFALLMGAAILAYVVLDGFDLGVGMLLPAAEEREQNRMVNSIGPFWDANETWLVLGIGILLVAFPVAHGVVLQALYLPVVAMLVGLMLRGVAFEFRLKAEGWHRELWNGLFWFGSFLASFAQGIMLGRYITGFEPGFGYFFFAFVVGAALCGGYVLLGATWLILKTEGATQAYARAAAPWTLAATLLFIAIVSIWTPLSHLQIAQRWFSFPNIAFLSPVPLITAALAIGIWRAISGRRDGLPFLLSNGLFLIAYAGLGISVWPYAIPEKITIWQAAGSRDTLIFLGIGTAIVLPITLAYLAYAHWVFRGKVSTGYEA